MSVIVALVLLLLVAPVFAGEEWGQPEALSTADVIEDYCRAMGGTSPATSGMVLQQLCIYSSAVGSDNVRLALYEGGNLSTGPAGADLLEDFGEVSGANEDWVCVASSSNPSISASTALWVGFKSGGTTFGIRYSSSSGDAGDFQSERGRWESASVNTDESVAWPSTWPADSGSFLGYWYSIYIVYWVPGPPRSLLLRLGGAH